MKIKLILFAATILLALSCDKKSDKIANHKVEFVTISDSVKLEVLDWGGSGAPMLFLAGLGNTAHVFDDFAPRFTDDYHVYALTRRGFGASSQPKNGYDLKTLTQDILSAVDQLHLKNVVLVGHSIAGEEMTNLAALYPDKVGKIIYLDAAYDRTGLGKLFAGMPQFPLPTASDSTDIQAVSDFMMKVVGVRQPKEELRQTGIFAKDGKFLKDATPGEIIAAMYGIVKKPDYASVKNPSLAIYSEQLAVNKLFPFYATLDSVNKVKADGVFKLWRAEQESNPARFLKESRHGVVKKIKGHHYIFISNPDETETAMREFLD
jgi:non-heme chloroperoxidase